MHARSSEATKLKGCTFSSLHDTRALEKRRELNLFSKKRMPLLVRNFEESLGKFNGLRAESPQISRIAYCWRKPFYALASGTGRNSNALSVVRKTG